MVNDNPQQAVSDERTPIQKFLFMIITNMFDRIMSGSIKYDTDLRQLEMYRIQAQKINDRKLEWEVVNTTVVLNCLSGYLNAGNVMFEELYQIAKELDNTYLMSTGLMNQGINLLDQTKYEEALIRFEFALQLLEEQNAEIATSKHMLQYGSVLGCKIELYLLINEYDKIAELYDQIQSIATIHSVADDKGYVITMLHARIGMAEVARNAREFDKASSHLQFAQSLASNLDIPYEYISLLLANMRIVLDKEELELADSYFDQTQKILTGLDETPYMGRMIMTEARLMASSGFNEPASNLARKALSIFRKNDMSEYIMLAEGFLITYLGIDPLK